MKYSATDKMLHELGKLKERKEAAQKELDHAKALKDREGIRAADAKLRAIQWEIENCL